MAGPFPVLFGDQFGDGLQAGFTMHLPGADAGREFNLQLLRAERAGQGGEAGVFRQTKQVPVINAGAEGGGKQQHRVGGPEALGEEIRRDQVLDGQAGPAAAAALEFAQGMITKAVCQFHEGHTFEHHFLQGQVRRVVGQVVGDHRDHRLQGTQQLRRQNRQEHRLGLFAVIPDQRLPGPSGAFQGGFHRFRGGFF